ncbi:hypothetical protein B0H14DRAFT_444278 [Mycena olivaceomarginata]|nr:hypothetical protein B0H14DRAFT_444278 [Mycena olivaceomarginata]
MGKGAASMGVARRQRLGRMRLARGLRTEDPNHLRMKVDRHMEQEGQSQRTALEDRNRSRCDSRPARCRRPRARFRACYPRCIDVRRAAADGTRPRVFRAFQLWGRRLHVPKQRGVSFPQPAHETSTNVNTNPAPAASYAPSYSAHSNTSSPANCAGPSANSNYGGSSASRSNYSASLTSYLSPLLCPRIHLCCFLPVKCLQHDFDTIRQYTLFDVQQRLGPQHSRISLRPPYAYGSLYEWDS